jgi:hypothetical protein
MLKRIFRTLAIVGALMAVLAGHANADGNGFLTELDSASISYQPAPMLNLGLAICEAFRGGASVVSVINVMNDKSPYTPYQNGEITRAAVDQLCPEQLARTLAEAKAITDASGTTTA